jgi:hypothetical protein
MAILQEVESFIAETGLTGEEAQQMRAIFEKSPKAQEQVKGGLLRQSDYSKHLNDVDKSKKDLEAKQAKLDAEFARLAAYGADADGKVLAAQRAVEAAEAKVVKATNRAKRWAETYGVPEEEVTEVFGATGTTETKTTPAPPQNPDDAPMTMGEFRRQVKEAMPQLAKIGSLSDGIMVDYHKLYGEFPTAKDMEAVIEGSLKSGRPLTEFAAEYYKFSEKRDALKEAKIEEKYKKQYEETLNTRLSEAHLPTSTRPAPQGAKIFNVKPAAPAVTSTTPAAPSRVEHANSVRNQMSTVQKAANSWREGKYAAQK